MASNRCTFAVIGGGIAGVSCAETLCHLTEETDRSVILISASPLIKAVINHQTFGHTMESMDIAETPSDTLSNRFNNLTVVHSSVTSLDVENKRLLLSNGNTVIYEKVCLATGAAPKPLSADKHVISIRDTESVKSLQEKITTAERIVVVGNGGIATELVYEVKSCEVVWCIKHKSISAAFFDESAAQFLLPHVQESSKEPDQKTISRRWKYKTESHKHTEIKGDTASRGNALGPDWANAFPITGAKQSQLGADKVKLEFDVEVERILTPDEYRQLHPACDFSTGKQWPVYVQLTNGNIYGSDLVINATGVKPQIGFSLTGLHKLEQDADDLGILIDTEMRSSCTDVYAAGDVVSTSNWKSTDHWFQMRLWTQAKQMGCYSAQCMYSHMYHQPIYLDICFELFTHVTTFFGFKVVLLGLYNAQGLDTSDYHVHLRCSKGEEYIKAVVSHGRLVGAVLIGDTDMEETYENLMLNKLDISRIEEALLDPDIDIEDYFD